MPSARPTPIAAPLRRQVAELLRDCIVSQEFSPGQRLLERELCLRFGVSRTVVREALRQCEAEGLIELVPNHGPVVYSASLPEAARLYEARDVLESSLARWCAERGAPAVKARLRRHLTQLERAEGRDDLSELLRVKDELYGAISDGADNPVLAAMLATLQIRVQALRRLSLQTAGRRQASLAELRALVAAIERGDGDGAAQLASNHVRNAATAALHHFSEDDDD